jgi:lambda family phage tail tape measure protein
MAAAAERAYTESVLAEAQAEAAAAAKQRAMLAARQANLATLVAQKRDIQFAAQAQADAAAITLAHQKNTATLSANLRAAADAERKLAAAMAAAIDAQNVVNAEMKAGEGITARLTAARGRLAAAEDAVAIAQARVAETRAAEAALGGLAATAGRAAKSFGAFAMGLVGGPWGLAVAAIGAVGYAIYKVNANWDDYLKHADEVAKSNEEVTQTLKDMAAAYPDVATRPNAGALSAGLGSAGKAAAAARKELDDLIAKRNELQDQRDRATARGGPGFLVDPKIAELDGKIAHAQSTLDDLTAAASKTQMQLMAELAPAIRNSAGPALDFLATKVYGARDSLAALHSLASLPSMFADFIPQAIEASKALEAYTKETDASTAAALKSIQGHGKSNEGLAQVRYELLKNSAAYKNMTDDQKAAAKSAYEADAALGRGLDALAAKHKAVKTSVDSAANAYENLKNSQEGQLATLRGQLAGTDGYSEAQKALNVMLAGGTSEFRKMKAAKQLDVIATQKQIVAMQLDVDKRNLQIASARQLADLDRQIAEEQADRARKNAAQVEGVGHGSQWNAERQAIDAVTDATRKQIAAEDARYRQAVDNATIAGTIGALQGQLDKTHLQMLGKITAAGVLDKQQTIEQFAAMKAAQSDWARGAQAALEDYQTSAANVATATHDLFSTALNGMSDAVANFVTTGKGGFESLAQSLISDLIKIESRILLSQALTSIFGSGIGTVAGYDAATPAQQVAYDVAVSGGRRSGGPVAGGNLYEVAEGGAPELLTSGGKTYLMMGAQGGNVQPAGWGGSAPVSTAPPTGGMMPVSIELNITNNGQAVTAKQPTAQMDGQKMMVNLVLDAVSNDMVKGGRVAQATQQRFGLQRRGVAVSGA